MPQIQCAPVSVISCFVRACLFSAASYFIEITNQLAHQQILINPASRLKKKKGGTDHWFLEVFVERFDNTQQWNTRLHKVTTAGVISLPPHPSPRKLITITKANLSFS